MGSAGGWELTVKKQACYEMLHRALDLDIFFVMT
jgi:hypothetical protein